MQNDRYREYRIRTARPEEFSRFGRMTVDVYAALAGMPTLDEQPDYYQRLLDVAKRASNPAIGIFAAVDDSDELLGSVDFIADMEQYGSGSAVGAIHDAAGIRLLAVRPECRGMGVGKALTRFCIDRAAALGKARVLLHTIRAMRTAWTMYERLGFERYPDIDFRQGNLDVFGFRLDLTHAVIRNDLGASARREPVGFPPPAHRAARGERDES